MVKNRDSVEIYAREINEPATLGLFLKAQSYGCRYQPNSPIAEALYFAPHFGRRIANAQPGVAVGISYIARIESVGRATTWREFQDLLQENPGRVWWKQHKDELQALRRATKLPSAGRAPVRLQPAGAQGALAEGPRLAEQAVLFFRRPLRRVEEVEL